MQMTCDNDCTRAGWREYYATGGQMELHVSIAPDADLCGVVAAFDHDEQEMISLNGWAWEFESILWVRVVE